MKRRWFARSRRRAWEDGHVSLGRGKDADPGGEQASLQRFVLKTRKCQAPVSQKESSTLAMGSHFDNSQASMVAEESQDLEMVHGSRAEEGAANGTGPTMVEHGLVSTQCPPPPATPEGDGLPAEATGGGNGEDAAAGNRT